MTWVLIVVMFSGGPNGGSTMTMHDFFSEDSCRKAEQQIITKDKSHYHESGCSGCRDRTNVVWTECVQK